MLPPQGGCFFCQHLGWGVPPCPDCAWCVPPPPEQGSLPPRVLEPWQGRGCGSSSCPWGGSRGFWGAPEPSKVLGRRLPGCSGSGCISPATGKALCCSHGNWERSIWEGKKGSKEAGGLRGASWQPHTAAAAAAAELFVCRSRGWGGGGATPLQDLLTPPPLRVHSLPGGVLLRTVIPGTRQGGPGRQAGGGTTPAGLRGREAPKSCRVRSAPEDGAAGKHRGRLPPPRRDGRGWRECLCVMGGCGLGAPLEVASGGREQPGGGRGQERL